MIQRCFVALLFVSLLCTCGPSPSKDTAERPAPATAPSTTSAAAVEYPSIPLERLEYIFENATYMDATFYNLPISINQSERPQIQSTIASVAQATMPLEAGCKTVGHIWFQVNGKNIEEADIFYEEQCVGYLWYENGKPAYSNMMTEAGYNFYATIFAQVNGQAPR